MRTCVAVADALRVWEESRTRTPLQRAFALACLGIDETEAERLMKSPVGYREARLLILQQQWFGDAMACLTRCPDCGQRIEFTVKASELLIRQQSVQPESVKVVIDGWNVLVRCPTSEDLTAVVDLIGDANLLRRRLLERCVQAHDKDGDERELLWQRLPEAVESRVIELMEERDPLGCIDITVVCPDCKRRWNAPFDVGSFLWNELEGWAKQMLRNVHMLASAYGWHEADILAMHPVRRECYLSMVLA